MAKKNAETTEVEEVSNETLLHAIKELTMAVKKVQDDMKTIKYNIQQIGMRR